MRVCAVFAVAATVACFACGQGAATLAPTAPVARPAASVASAPPEAPPDLSPLPPPDRLLFTAHLAHPGRALQMLAPIVSAVPALGAFVSLDPDTLVTLAIGAPVASILDLDQPLDLAAADGPAPDSSMAIVASAALAAGPQVRETLEKYFKAGPPSRGVVHLEPRADTADGDDAARPCVVAPSAAGGSRLVCGSSAKAVSSLTPYLVRTMTRTTSTADLRLELMVREANLADRDSQSFDSGDSTDALWHALTEKLGDDVGTMTLEASLGLSGLDVTLTTGFSAAASPITRALLGQATPAGPPPPAFDRLPRDASSVWYSRGDSAADLVPLRTALFSDLRRSLGEDGYSPAAIDEIGALLDRLFLTGGPWVAASGHRLDTARAALDAYVAAGKTGEAARAKTRGAVQGWMVAAVDEPPQKWIDGLRELVKTDSLKPVNKPVHKDKPQKELWRMTMAPVPAALKLPAGTVQAEVRVTANPAWPAAQKKAGGTAPAAVTPHTVHLFVVPDGSRTWLAAGEDAAAAATEVRASLAGAPDDGTLKARRDLDALRSAATSAGAILSVEEVVLWKADDSSDADLHALKRTLDALATLAADGTTPVPLTMTATPKSGDASRGGELAVRLVLPLAVITEVAKAPPGLF